MAGLGISLVALLTAFLLSILRHLPKLLSGVVIGACIFVSLVLPPSGFVFVPLAILFGAAAATVFSQPFSSAHLSKKILTFVLGLASLTACITLVVILAGSGTEKDEVKLQQAKSTEPAPLDAANPSERGPRAVKSLFYGSGADLRRPEYNSKVSIKTPSVDASLFFKDFTGWQEKLRRFYWGFGVDRLPLNARVWYPDGAGPFPLVLIVHGNHDMAEFSDPGYQYLGELLASRGFILASIDENFLNSWLAELPKEQAVRGWMLLEHLKLWRKWNAEPAILSPARWTGKYSADGPLARRRSGSDSSSVQHAGVLPGRCRPFRLRIDSRSSDGRHRSGRRPVQTRRKMPVDREVSYLTYKARTTPTYRASWAVAMGPREVY